MKILRNGQSLYWRNAGLRDRGFSFSRRTSDGSILRIPSGPYLQRSDKLAKGGENQNVRSVNVYLLLNELTSIPSFF